MLYSPPDGARRAAFHQGEGYDAYRWMGAHKTTLDGQAWQFTVWAPNALRVCVTGEFCSWRYEDYPMQKQYDGTWELRLPAALFDAQEYEAAAKAFAELGSYEDAKQRVTDSEDAWLSADYNSARMDTELGNYAAVIDELAAYYESELPPRYAQMHDMYESACLARAQELTALGKPLDALPILKRIEGNKTAKKRMEAYVYQLIGRWKDTRGTEYVFREDGSCCIAGKEGYFGGSGYEITVGDEPYPTKGEYSVVSVRGKTVTLRGLQSGRTIRLSYLGEPTDREESADNPEN